MKELFVCVWYKMQHSDLKGEFKDNETNTQHHSGERNVQNASNNSSSSSKERKRRKRGKIGERIIIIFVFLLRIISSCARATAYIRAVSYQCMHAWIIQLSCSSLCVKRSAIYRVHCRDTRSTRFYEHCTLPRGILCSKH